MKNKVVKIVTAGIIAASLLAGCGSTGSNTSSANNAGSASSESTSSETSATDSAAGTTTDNASGKVLVMYYSASGNTKKIADDIASAVNGTEYEITPSEPYTDADLNYSDKSSRVVKEHEDESLQNVAFDSYDIPDWDSYDTVFVGYPIWWQDASWVVKSFVKNVDFSGKTVIPFCTSSASGLGDSGKNLAAIARTGDWKDGERFSGSASASDVESWVKGLGF